MIRHFALAFVLAASASAAYADDNVATVVDLKGDVKVNQGTEFLESSIGQRLKEGDRILVMEGGDAWIRFDDGCRQEIKAGSLVTVSDKSTCAGAIWHSQQIAPSGSGAVGGDVGAYSTVNGVGWTWIGVATACFIWCRTEDHDNTVSP